MICFRFHEMKCLGCIIGVLLLSLTTVVLARDAVVTTTDGRQFEGELISEDSETITLLISGIRTPLPRDEIRDIQYRMTVEDQYQQRLAELNPEDLFQRYELAKWLFDNKSYDLAKHELDEIKSRLTIASPPELHQQTELLSRAVVARIKLLDPDQPGDSTAIDADEDGQIPGQGETAQKQPEHEMLSEEEINRIKVYELPQNLAESKLSITIPDGVIDELFEKYHDDQRLPRGQHALKLFKAKPGYEQIDLFFSLQAREFYDKIQVRQDPPAMMAFRRKVHRKYVLNYCAATACHGGPDAGELYLFRQAPESRRTAYTNFFILQSISVDQHDVIDRTDADQSLLLHYGLKRDATTTPHPDVPGWHPRLMSKDVPFYKQIQAWITSLWKTPINNYGIRYSPRAVSPSEETQNEGTPQPETMGGQAPSSP